MVEKMACEPFSSPDIPSSCYLRAVPVKFSVLEVLAVGACGLASSQSYVYFKSFENQNMS